MALKLDNKNTKAVTFDCYFNPAWEAFSKLSKKV